MARDNNSEFYAARAQDAVNAKDGGDMDALARIAAQVLIEEGGQGLARLTEAVRNEKGRR
ncbi:hypothetical protein [Streptomyces sp. NPDC056670]|uniref:hypothetical protein n=1 Tax=Streptomyces sp. NPDC056670 TaxID=3345904 RepID=UPI0036A79335